MGNNAKCKFDKYISQQISKFYDIIRNDMMGILPRNYNFEMIYDLLQEYYPFELRAFQFQLDGYKHQDKTLKQHTGKERYHVKSIEFYLTCKPIVYLLTPEFISKRAALYNQEQQDEAKIKFVQDRTFKISKIKNKIALANQKAQDVEPVFLDKMMGQYDKKRATQKDRVYILHELYKYDCSKVTKFLQKQLNHEQNFQLREMILKHLQDYGYAPQLRGKTSIPLHTRNKKRKAAIREYRNLKFNINGIPDELSYLIKNSKAQNIKSYDFFISHSYIDHDEIQKLINSLNQKNINIYCDWISDSDYLKRKLVCDATLEVINKRIEQSDAVLFVDSIHSRSSQWVAHELQYAEQLNKPIKFLNANQASEHISEIAAFKDKWYNSFAITKLL